MAVDPEQAAVRIADALDALHCGAVLVDRDDVILHANARFCQMMECPLAELRAQPLWEFYPPEDAGALRRRFRSGTDHEVEEETYLPRIASAPLPVIISSWPLTGTGPHAGCRVLTVIDVSRQKQAETRYHEQYREVARLSDTVLEQALDLKHYSRELEDKVRQRTAELQEANFDSILMLAVASETRDTDTGAHVLRIQEYTHTIAGELGLSEGESEMLGHSAILHDVGKIQVPDEILKKPGPLTTDERRAMESHTIAGERILSKRPFFDTARAIARSHHENWDSSGYPDRRSGEDIPLAARIVHLADVFDALTSPRVYKAAWPLKKAIAEVERCSGTMFEPRLVQVFRALLQSGAFDRTLARRAHPGPQHVWTGCKM
jgi:putative nucleotidyltransferase with HDIG domain